jgi:hypothetical protein
VLENNFDAVPEFGNLNIVPLLNNYLESGLGLAVGVGGTSCPAAGCAFQFVDDDMLDLELEYYEVLRRFQYGLYVNNFT